MPCCKGLSKNKGFSSSCENLIFFLYRSFQHSLQKFRRSEAAILRSPEIDNTYKNVSFADFACMH
jgi:hypothetical protein